MAFDNDLADRVRAITGHEPGFDERRMFGSIIFMVNSNMASGVNGSDLIVRIGPDHADALSEPGCREFDLSGRPMKNWVLVDSAVLDDEADLEKWCQLGVEFAQSLPPK